MQKKTKGPTWLRRRAANPSRPSSAKPASSSCRQASGRCADLGHVQCIGTAHQYRHSTSVHQYRSVQRVVAVSCSTTMQCKAASSRRRHVRGRSDNLGHERERYVNATHICTAHLWMKPVRNYWLRRAVKCGSAVHQCSLQRCGRAVSTAVQQFSREVSTAVQCQHVQLCSMTVPCGAVSHCSSAV